jgi:hypothetical protein
VGTPFATETGAACGRSRTRCRRVHLLPLPPRRRAAVCFLPVDEPGCPSSPTPALSEERLLLPFVKPGHRAKGWNVAPQCHCTAAPSRYMKHGLRAVLGCFFVAVAADITTRAQLASRPFPSFCS